MLPRNKRKGSKGKTLSWASRMRMWLMPDKAYQLISRCICSRPWSTRYFSRKRWSWMSMPKAELRTRKNRWRIWWNKSWLMCSIMHQLSSGIHLQDYLLIGISMRDRPNLRRIFTQESGWPTLCQAHPAQSGRSECQYSLTILRRPTKPKHAGGLSRATRTSSITWNLVNWGLLISRSN